MDIKHLITRLLEKEIAKRADLSEVQQHPWTTKNEELIKYIYEANTEDSVKFFY